MDTQNEDIDISVCCRPSTSKLSLQENKTMTNNSHNAPVNYLNLAQNIAYILMAGPSLIINVLLSFVIVKTQSLRRRNDILIYCGLLVADAVLALGLCCQGIKRTWWNLNGPLPMVNAWYCMTSVPETPIILGRFLVAFMFLIVSIDRLFSVYHLNSNLECSKVYATAMLVLPYGMSLLALCVGWFLSSQMPATPATTAMCVIDYAFPFAYNVAMFLIESVFGLVGCFNHLLVYVVVRIRSKPTTTNANNSNLRSMAARANRQVKVSKTLALICVQAFIFCVIPATMKAVTNIFEISSAFSVIITPYLGLMTILSTFLNAAMYWAKQNDVKRESFYLIKRTVFPNSVLTDLHLDAGATTLNVLRKARHLGNLPSTMTEAPMFLSSRSPPRRAVADICN